MEVELVPIGEVGTARCGQLDKQEMGIDGRIVVVEDLVGGSPFADPHLVDGVEFHCCRVGELLGRGFAVGPDVEAASDDSSGQADFAVVVVVRAVPFDVVGKV